MNTCEYKRIYASVHIKYYITYWYNAQCIDCLTASLHNHIKYYTMHSEYRMQVLAENGATFRSGWNSYNRVREFNTITYSVFSFYFEKICQNIIALLGCRSVYATAKIGAGLWWDSKFEKLQNFYLIQLEPIFQGSVSFKCCWAKTQDMLFGTKLGWTQWVASRNFLPEKMVGGA